jgi:hypothetical protein
MQDQGSGNRIKAAGMKRMTSGQASQSQPSTANNSVARHCFQRILGTGRMKPAARWQKGRDEELISADQQRRCSTGKGDDPPDHYSEGMIASRHANNSPRNCAKVAWYALGRARTTRSHAGCMPRTSRRHTSRSRRRTRLRATAEDWNRGTISPIRGWPVSFLAHTTSRCCVRYRVPCSRQRRMSELRASRWARARRSLAVRTLRAWTAAKQ